MTTYDDIADTRPKIRRDVLFAKLGDGVLFHNSEEGFEVRSAVGYQLASLIVPHLTGTNTVSSLCGGLGDAQRTMIAELISALYEHAFARDERPAAPDAQPLLPEVVATFGEQIGYIDHYVDEAQQRFLRFRETAVAVLGDDAIAAWCALSLVRNGAAHIGVQFDQDNARRADARWGEVFAEAEAMAQRGCPVSIDRLARGTGPTSWADLDGYEVVVISAGAGGAATVFELKSAGIPAGRTLLPITTTTERAFVGPLMSEEATTCWVCAVLRQTSKEDDGGTAQLWRRISLPDTDAPNPPTRPLTAMLGNLAGYEVFRLLTGALPAETQDKVIVQQLASTDVATERLLPHPRCPFCATKSAGPLVVDLTVKTETVEDDGFDGTSALVGRKVGVFTAFNDDTLGQSPVKLGRLTWDGGEGTARTIAAFDEHTLLRARLKALYTAAAVYADHVVPLRDVHAGGADDAITMIDPMTLDVASGIDIITETIGAWVPAVSLPHKETALVPAGAVQPFGRYNTDRRFGTGSAGSGAGATDAAAVGRGLLSAIAYRALVLAIRGRRQVSEIGLDSVGDHAELVFLLRSAQTMGIGIQLLDLGEAAESSAQVMLARTVEDGITRYAVAAELDPLTCAVRAVGDLLGRIQLGRETDGVDSVDCGDELVDRFDAAALTVAAEVPLPAGQGTTFGAILENLRSAGDDAYAVRTTSEDLARGGVATARVLLTGRK
ncbi:MAG TPA: TOMM precursor leader peptide-binding protein [Pseudonocardiaceae bacterium]